MYRKVTCKKCGTKCCTCQGCNPNTYVDGLCPRCQQLEKENKNNDTKVLYGRMQRLFLSQDNDREDRLFLIQSDKKQT